MLYHGKGKVDRAKRSAKEVEDRTADKVTKTATSTAASDTDAFIEEARRIAADGGIGGGRLHNRINSPGKKLL